MGIRYERDQHKPTNGPMFFFSILHDEVFEEETRSAFRSGLSFYAYRFPHDNMLCFGSTEGYLEGIGEPGFVVSRFDPALPYITIPYKPAKNMKGQTSNSPTFQPSDVPTFTQPTESTPFSDYSGEVEEIIGAIKKGEGEKVVAARVIVKEDQIDIAEEFYRLCGGFPDAFVFCFSTPATGCWIGATPELLLEGKEDELRTMALAGTRPAGTATAWDAKNIEEQRIVTDYIGEVFRSHGLDPKIGETITKMAGPIEHICTPVTAEGAGLLEEVSGNGEESLLSQLLRDLSPTPALCGYPKTFGLEKIRELESFPRGCYGGFCGPYRSLRDFTFHVVLRCASVSERRICAYVGGGITAASSVAAEWQETALKATNLFADM